MLLQLLTISATGGTKNGARMSMVELPQVEMPQMALCTPAEPYATGGLYAAVGPRLYAAGGIDAADGTLAHLLEGRC